jgi:carboxylesterase
MEQKEKITEPILYQIGANREAILILHGFAVDISHTDLLFDYFVSKGYTVARPIMPGHTGLKEDLKSFGPEEWLANATNWLERLEQEHDKVFILGISFGSNLAVSLAASGLHPKIAGLVVSEMPIFFNRKIWWVMHLLQPLYQLLGIEFISKDGPLYRSNHQKRYGAFNFIPVKVAGQIRQFIAKRTKQEILDLKVPVFVLQAERSDLLNSKKTQRYICESIQADQRKIYCLPINNHDLNVLDDAGKLQMLEQINEFILEKK